MTNKAALEQERNKTTQQVVSAMRGDVATVSVKVDPPIDIEKLENEVKAGAAKTFWNELEKNAEKKSEDRQKAVATFAKTHSHWRTS